MGTIGKGIFVGLAVAAAAAAGCGGHTDAAQKSASNATDNESGAKIELALTTGGTTINKFHYDITGPTNKSDDVDITNSVHPSAVIGGLAVGTGYKIDVKATSVAEAGLPVTCGLRTPVSFDIPTPAAGTDASPLVPVSVNVSLYCVTPTTTGSVALSGTVNVCPVITSFGTAPGQPAEVKQGYTIGLAAAAVDSDTTGLTGITYTWGVGDPTSASLDDPSSATPTLTCKTTGAGGNIAVTLVVGQTGDSQCQQVATFTVTCTPVARCGDSSCNGTEVCACQAGDARCAAAHAGKNECLSDCGQCNIFPAPVCGDGQCVAPDETLATCPADCEPSLALFAAKKGKTCTDALQTTCLKGTAIGTTSSYSHTCAYITGTTAATAPLPNVSQTSVCLSTLSCLVTSSTCWTANGDAPSCYCGDSGTQCTTPGKADGVCLAQEQNGMETTDPNAINQNWLFEGTGAGVANQLVQCILDKNITACE